MKNKMGIIGISLVIILVLFVASLYMSIHFKCNSLEKGLRDHLIKIEGYSSSDIISIKAKLSSMPKYPVYVRFADDPETDYIFTDGGGEVPDWYQLDPKNPQRLKRK